MKVIALNESIERSSEGRVIASPLLRFSRDERRETRDAGAPIREPTRGFFVPSGCRPRRAQDSASRPPRADVSRPSSPVSRVDPTPRYAYNYAPFSPPQYSTFPEFSLGQHQI